HHGRHRIAHAADRPAHFTSRCVSGRSATARVRRGAPSLDLARGPLLRATLVRLADEEHIIFVVMHHIASDGWSIGILNREITSLYDAFVAGRPCPLAPLPIQYADYAAWQRRWLSGETLDRQLDYWKERLAGSPDALDLPTDHPRPGAPEYRGGTHRF